MKGSFFLLVVCTLLIFTGCAPIAGGTLASETTSPSSRASVLDVKTPEMVLDELAAQKFEEYRPTPGNAAAFEQDGIWYAVYHKTCIESCEQAREEYPDKVIPAEIGSFAFAGFYPYDTGFSGVDSYVVSELTDQNIKTGEGLIPLPDSCGRNQYGVRYQTPEGKLLILTVDEDRNLAEDNVLTRLESEGTVFYVRPNQPYTLGIQVKGGPALWLHSVFPETGVAYTEDDPRAELSPVELQALLLEAESRFSQG